MHPVYTKEHVSGVTLWQGVHCAVRREERTTRSHQPAQLCATNALQVDSIVFTHKPPTRWQDHVGLAAVTALRKTFDWGTKCAPRLPTCSPLSLPF